MIDEIGSLQNPSGQSAQEAWTRISNDSPKGRMRQPLRKDHGSIPPLEPK
jgi:hypothetical protein